MSITYDFRYLAHFQVLPLCLTHEITPGVIESSKEIKTITVICLSGQVKYRKEYVMLHNLTGLGPALCTKLWKSLIYILILLAPEGGGKDGEEKLSSEDALSTCLSCHRVWRD